MKIFNKDREKNKNKKLNFKIDLNKIYSLMFFITLVWIICICILESNYQFNPIFLIGLMIIFFSILVFIYKKINKRFENLSNKATWIFYDNNSIYNRLFSKN